LHIKNLFGLTFLAFVSLPVLATETTPALAIASLTDPAKLATLKGERAASPHLQGALAARAGAG